MSPLVLGEILGVFLNILAANTNYPVKDFENLQLPVQMRLSKQRKSFSQVFVPFLESTLNFKHFEKKDDRHDRCVSEITESENLVRTFSKEPRFTTDFGSQHVNIDYIQSFQNACKISMRALLSCFFIILTDVDLKNISPSVR